MSSELEQILMAQLNQELLGTFGHGIHTCVAAFALWAIFSSKERRTKTRNFMVFVIVFLYILATIFVATYWAYVVDLHITRSELEAGPVVSSVSRWATGVTTGISTDIADCITIWRCWIVWGRRWSVVILPILLFLTQGVSGCFAFHQDLYANSDADGNSTSEINWTMIYLSFSLGTTLLCTTLIIYRIVTVKKGTADVAVSTNTYRRVIEILVESASLYAIALIGYMVLLSRNTTASFYPQIIYVSITGISPTLIVARVASGNARPDESWQASSNVSSLRFGSADHSASMNADGELTSNGQDVDMEQGRSEATHNRELEEVVNTGQGSENRRRRSLQIFDHGE